MSGLGPAPFNLLELLGVLCAMVFLEGTACGMLRGAAHSGARDLPMLIPCLQ